MTEIFGTVYGDAYDLLYHDKDYGSECDQRRAVVPTLVNTWKSQKERMSIVANRIYLKGQMAEWR